MQREKTPDNISVKPGDVVPGNVVYSKVNKNSYKIAAFVSLGLRATVNIRSETGVKSNGDDTRAWHVLTVDGSQKDRVEANDGFNDWNGIVETTMVFEAGRTYEIRAEAGMQSADPINTDLMVTVLSL